MVRNGWPARAARARVLQYVCAAAAAVACLAPRAASAQGHAHSHRATIVRLTTLGLSDATGDSVRVLVWATGPARVGLGTADPAALTDTLRLNSLPAITADVTQSDVHIQLLSPGRMRLGGEVSGGRAIRFTAVGRHIVVLKGGVGADTVTDP